MNPRSVVVMSELHSLGRQWCPVDEDARVLRTLIRDAMPQILAVVAIRHANSKDRNTILYKGFPRGMRRQMIDDLDRVWKKAQGSRSTFGVITPAPHSVAGYSLTSILLSLMSWEPLSWELRLNYEAYEVLGDYAIPLLEQLQAFLAIHLVSALFFMKQPAGSFQGAIKD